MTPDFDYYDEEALLERLTKGLTKRSQEVIFLVGAPFSAPPEDGLPGVPDVNGIISLIRQEFADDKAQFDQALLRAGNKRYQAAFQFLQGRRGQQAANEIVRSAVRAARRPDSIFTVASNDAGADEAYRLMESDIAGWSISPATASLGKLIAHYPERFGRTVLTTNFDPLIEVAIRLASGQYFRTTLHLDGNLSQTEGSGCHVIHLHGYWYGSDTLHTARQLGQSRPRLRASLASLLRHKLVVVCAYGGWDDSFTEALMDVVRDDAANPEIIWTFYAAHPVVDEQLGRLLEPGINRGRVNLYSGVDCHHLLPNLYNAWEGLAGARPIPTITRSNPVHVRESLRATLDAAPPTQTVLEGDEEDRPPVVDVWVGRSEELRTLVESEAKVVLITGIGGQGKSGLAARYFSASQAARKFSVYIWRDCKEESEHFENQLASVVEKLSRGRVRGEDLAKRSVSSVIQLLEVYTRGLDVLFIFDNADHYVDLERNTVTGSAQAFVDALLHSATKSRVVFTCRPVVDYGDPRILCLRLGGITFGDASSLFEQRGAEATETELQDAYSLTEGHALGLNLLAIQTTKRLPNVRLKDILDEIRAGSATLGDKTLDSTLQSIWITLRQREQLVLRTMAETLKPETEVELGEYLPSEINYNKLMKALKTLRDLNLVVVKQLPNAPDVMELHPLVRQFVRNISPGQERRTIIDPILKVYKRFIGNHKSQLREAPPISLLLYWTQDAELSIRAGKLNDAFAALYEVGPCFLSSAYPREFCRVAKILFEGVNWKRDSRLRQFEGVLNTYVRLLSHLGEHGQVDVLLDEYEDTIQDRGSQYVRYCEMRSNAKWLRGEFTEAVAWGEKGTKLIEESGVDIDDEIAHTLALARRDAGEPESALSVFLRGRALLDVLDPEELDERAGGAFYGNVGRCLHLLGQIESALTCYQKSALLIEKDFEHERVLNQGYIRLWVGELLVARQQYTLAHTFFRAAYLKWKDVYPARMNAAIELSDQIRARLKDKPSGDELVERICLDWIKGRSIDG